MGTLVSAVEIKIDGQSYKKTHNIFHIVLTQELLRPNELRFTMQKRGLDSENIADSQFTVPKSLIGARVELKIVSMRFDKEKKKEIEFKGIIDHVEIRHRSDMTTEQLVDVHACSPDFLLIDHPHCFSYEEAGLKAIVENTINPYSDKISSEINPRTTASIPYTVQYNESNYQFLIRLAKRYGEWMYHTGKKWIFGKMVKSPLIILDPRHDILDYSFQAGLRHHKHTHAHHDYLKYENPSKSDSNVSDLKTNYHTLTNEAVRKSASLFKKKTFQHLQGSNPEENEMDELKVSTEAQLLGDKMLQLVCTGSTLCADLTIGSVIKIKDIYYKNSKEHTTIEHDELVITGITHSTEVDGHYSNYFTAHSAKSELPPYAEGDLFPVSSAQRAKVMDNKDPEKLGRIRVQFLWQEEQDADLMTPWIRISQPHGGGDKGFYYIPEIDEEVMVDFENGNAEKPYVAGTLYHGDDQRPDDEWYTDSNDIKAIRTRNGHTIEIHDEGDDGFIRIYDYKKENYILTFSTDEKLIKLESTGNIELYAKKNIIMKADENIEMEAGTDIKGDAGSNMELSAGSEMSLESGTNMSLDAGASMSLDATSGMTLDAPTIDATAKGKMTLDGGGMLEAKAGMVKIN